MRLFGIAALVFLTACSPVLKEEEALEVEPVTVEPVAPSSSLTDCAPGDDDGIGGTGCQLD